MKPKAIALCRVSTARQKTEGHSLQQQEESVMIAAQELDVELIKTWSLDTSSKAGLNLKRKDLDEIRQFCKRNRNIKYLLVDRVSRLMREAKRFIWYIVELEDQGVKTYFTATDQRHLNSDNQMSLLSTFFNAVQAEQENREKALANTQKMKARVASGYYPFRPLQGYIKTDVPGIHDIDPVRFRLLKTAFKDISSGMYTPSEALKKLNNSGYLTPGGKSLDIEHFTRLLSNPFYAGIIKVSDWDRSKGLHQPMIDLDGYKSVQDIISTRKPKFRRKQFNPHFPMSKYLMHDCQPNSVFTGANQSNRKGGKLYPKYRCRSCGKQYRRDSVHAAITHALDKFDYSGAQQKHFIDALTTVWRQKQQDNLKQVEIAQKRLEKLLRDKSDLVRLLANSDESLRPDIEIEIKDIKAKVDKAEKVIRSTHHLQEDMIGFVKFALEYTNALKEDWWQLEEESRLQCKQLLFPAGITFDSTEKVSTTQISPLYRLAATKKNLNFTRDSLLVELELKSTHSIWNEISRWRAILASDYERFKLTGQGVSKAAPLW